MNVVVLCFDVSKIHRIIQKQFDGETAFTNFGIFVVMKLKFHFKLVNWQLA